MHAIFAWSSSQSKMAQNIDTAGSGPTGCQIEHMFGTAGISFFAPSSANVFTSMGESVPSIAPTTKLPMTGRNYTSEAQVTRREHSADTMASSRRTLRECIRCRYRESDNILGIRTGRTVIW